MAGVYAVAISFLQKLNTIKYTIGLICQKFKIQLITYQPPIRILFRI